mmetsp:Transcript_3219/g.14517  ORF Transcript_3219/g.14517 Transcript_3219/m.14517 type:complete len:230 (+) Transcript_3219:9803-10492(+)
MRSPLGSEHGGQDGRWLGGGTHRAPHAPLRGFERDQEQVRTRRGGWRSSPFRDCRDAKRGRSRRGNCQTVPVRRCPDPGRGGPHPSPVTLRASLAARAARPPGLFNVTIRRRAAMETSIFSHRRNLRVRPGTSRRRGGAGIQRRHRDRQTHLRGGQPRGGDQGCPVHAPRRVTGPVLVRFGANADAGGMGGAVAPGSRRRPGGSRSPHARVPHAHQGRRRGCENHREGG